MEMGRRDGANRFSKKQSGSVLAAKSKKGMLKNLCLADEKKQELCSSDLENEITKKSKLSKKNLKETNGVNHASVPRKLRSAMKKRKLESVSKLSFASKRLNRSKTGIESFKKDLIKKENQEMESKAIVLESMMISKDEKEVAETLYSLAEMFTESNSIDKKTCDEKETNKVDSILVMEAGFNKTESFEPAVSVNVIDATARAIETKVETSGMDHKSNGLVLWPGLSSTVRTGARVLSKPSSSKLPPWMGPIKNASLESEPLRIQPRKLKKCASHVYISRLIKVLQASKSSNQTEQRSSELSERGLPDPVVSQSKRYKNPHLLDVHETHDPKPVQEDMTKLALELYNPHTLHKQSFDFLSLSSTRETQSHFPHHYISEAYNSQLSPATSSHQVHQLSPYLANHQQLQRRLWAAQYRPASGNIVSPSLNQFCKPNLSLNLTSIQSLQDQVASSSRYSNNVTQQQQHSFMVASAAMSMSHHRQEHHFPLMYEDSRTSLQLLCSKQS